MRDLIPAPNVKMTDLTKMADLIELAISNCKYRSIFYALQQNI